MKKIIVVAIGGYGSEREISIKSGSVIFDTLKDSPYDCYLLDIALTQWSLRDRSGSKLKFNKGDFSFEKNGIHHRIDAVVNMVHGVPGENGILAGYLDLLNIPHTSCDSAIAGLTFNKRQCLAVASELGIPTAKRFLLNQGDKIQIETILKKIGLPCFVKANRAGSSFGIYRVVDENELEKAIEDAFKEDNQLLIESALEGREVTVGVLEWKGEVLVLPITEIITENAFFDYQAKYEGQSTEITPAQLSKQWSDKVSEMAKKLYLQLGLKGITRSEFIFQDGIPHLLEINTIPGMTQQSIIPQQAKQAGIELGELIEGIIQNCLTKKRTFRE